MKIFIFIFLFVIIESCVFKPNDISVTLKNTTSTSTNDPYWSSTLMLVKCNNNALVEHKGHIFTNNGVVTSTAEKKFGSSSCYFNGGVYLLNNSTD